VLHPNLCELTSHPFACHLACESLASRIVAEVSHRPAASVDCCQGRCTSTMPATRPHTAPLLPPSLLTPRAAHLASSSLAPRRVAMASTLHVQLTTPTPAYRQNSHPSRALHSAHCCPHCALPPHRAESLAPSLYPCAGPHCFYVIHNYKRDLPRAFCPCPHRCLPPISCHRRTTSVFHRSEGAKPPHPTSLPVRRS
jgi:hypothetical protein